MAEKFLKLMKTRSKKFRESQAQQNGWPGIVKKFW